jgi:hypothetical protein
MIALINRLFARRPVAYPRTGQIWRSEHSGKAVLVTDVVKTETGVVMVSVKHERDQLRNFNGMQADYAFGLDHWRARIREEARFLELTLHSFPPHPLPAPPPKSP